MNLASSSTTTKPLCKRCNTFFALPDDFSLCIECKLLTEREEIRDVVKTLDIRKMYLLSLTRNKIQRDSNIISFNQLKEKTLLSEGSVTHIMNSLEKLGLVSIKKQFINNKKPLTTYSITEKGIEYLDKMESIVFL